MIQIQPYSFISSISLYFTALYLRTIHQFFKIKLRLTHPAQRTFRPTTYFVVQSKFFSFKDATKRIETIRKYDKRGKIVLIGEHIDYELLFRNHYLVFGVIDRTNDHSLKFLKQQIWFYLEEIYRLFYYNRKNEP